MKPAIFFLLRHGQTDWNKQARLQGSTDIALNDHGKEQALLAAEKLASQDCRYILTSPLTRARQTAEILASHLGLAVQIDPRLSERHFGAFEGMTIDEVLEARKTMLPSMNPEPDLDGMHYPKNAETITEVYQRINPLLDEIKDNDGVLLVSHGIPFRLITKIILGQMHSSPNASPVRFDNSSGLYEMVILDPDRPPVTAQTFTGPTTMGRL